MPKNLYILGSLLFILIAFESCTTDDSSFPVGEDWVTSDTRVLYIDTMTVASGTFLFDSIQVTQTGRLLLGAYRDSVFGSTKSRIFSRLTNSVYSVDNDARFDSIALILRYDNYFYNDTLSPQRIRIYPVTQDIVAEEDGNYYNTSTFDYDKKPIGNVSFTPRPVRDDSLHLLLHADFGQKLFDELQDNTINNSDEFLNRYPGILLDPDEDNTAILGFQSTSLIRLYYSIENETGYTDDVIDFAFDASNTFHNISGQRQSTYFANLKDQKDLVTAQQAGGYSYIQSGTGLATRIAFPNLSGLSGIEGSGTLLYAQLGISLNTHKLSDQLHVGDSLVAYIVDQRSQILSTLYDYNGNAAYGVITQMEDEFPILTYTLPIHYFLDQKATNFNGENWYLALISKNFNQSVDRYIFNGNQADDDSKLKIKLTYAIYDN